MFVADLCQLTFSIVLQKPLALQEIKQSGCSVTRYQCARLIDLFDVSRYSSPQRDQTAPAPLL